MEEGGEEFLGRWKSGRAWKGLGEKASKKIVSRGLGQKNWQEKVQERQERAMERAQLAELREARKQRQESAKRQRQEARLRREANLKRSEVVQKISNPRKLARMSKKQLRALRRQNL